MWGAENLGIQKGMKLEAKGPGDLKMGEMGLRSQSRLEPESYDFGTERTWDRGT